MYQIDIFEKNRALIGEKAFLFFAGKNTKNLHSALQHCGFLTENEGDFSELGKLFLLKSNNPNSFIKYVYFSGKSFSEAHLGGISIFEQFLEALDTFKYTMSKYEDRRSSLERKEEFEISEELFSASLAKYLVIGNVINNMLLIEQSDIFGTLRIRTQISKPQDSRMKNFVSFLKGVGLVPWFFYSTCKNACYTNLAFERTLENVREITLRYYSFVYKEGIIGRNQYARGLTFSEQQTLYVAETLGTIRREDVVFKTGISPRAASYALKRLVEKDILRRIGQIGSRNSVYELVSKKTNQ